MAISDLGSTGSRYSLLLLDGVLQPWQSEGISRSEGMGRQVMSKKKNEDANYKEIINTASSLGSRLTRYLAEDALKIVAEMQAGQRTEMHPKELIASQVMALADAVALTMAKGRAGYGLPLQKMSEIFDDTLSLRLPLHMERVKSLTKEERQSVNDDLATAVALAKADAEGKAAVPGDQAEECPCSECAKDRQDAKLSKLSPKEQFEAIEKLVDTLLH